MLQTKMFLLVLLITLKFVCYADLDSLQYCLTPAIALTHPNACTWFPVLVECDHQTKMIQCTCKSTSNARERADYEFNPVYIQSRYIVRDFSLWKFPTDHRLYKTFPIDPELKNYVRQVPQTVFSITQSIPFKTGSKLAVMSTKALTDILDLSPQVADSPDFVKFVSGDLRSGSCSDIQKDEIHSTCPATTEPETVNPSCVGPLCRVIALSHRYGGHQFGQWAGQLGDGRAVMLGEYVNSQGERWELQLKGSGLTPYSRRGDGRAVIRSSVREFLCSEAMYHLGIPTSRAASLAVSNDTVIRDQFYDGHPQRERTAVVLRLARSWFRIGSLEILAYSGEHELLQKLVDFVIAEYFPDISVKDTGKYLAFFQEVVRDTASLIAQWQSVGFTHGVCNTDNFSLLSVTIDYGPFGFLDEYDPSFVPNTSDDESRYSYEKQPDVGAYNLEKLRLALEPLWSEDEKSISNKILMSYGDHYKQKFMEIFSQKLGLETNGGDDDQNLVAVLLKIMSDTKADFTMTFRDLSEMSLSDLQSGNIHKQFWALRTAARHDWFEGWVRLYAKRLSAERQSDARRRYIMENTNPRYVLRNWIAQLAVDRTQDNDFSVINKIHRILQNPFRYQEEAESMRLASKPPQWAKQLKVSCSS